MAQAAADAALNRYPDPLACGGLRRLRTGLWPSVQEQVTAGNGSDELISLILSVLFDRRGKRC